MTCDLLSIKCFESHEVWCWNESMDGYVPVELTGSTLPDDKGDLFIKVSIEAANGKIYEGYIAGLNIIHAITIFIDNKIVGFNKYFSESLIKKDIENFRLIVGDSGFPLFPMKYKAKFHFRDKNNVEGIFDL